ncbi:DUF4118 domain-containing protein [Novosphingopyxis sp. YJ-S2-01]|nr:DUF4118 domain-containing protein [Novosphingopyxis sp. YJ-S2-01]
MALGHFGLMGLNITGTALLMLLPVLWVASRTDAAVGAGMALLASIALNFFLLPPLYTFTIDGPTYVVIFIVFVAVALVTGAFAAGLRARRNEAAARAEDSEFETLFLAEIALATDRRDLDRRAAAFLARHYGDARIFTRDRLAAQETGLSPLDASAAIWSLDHEAVTGHASEVMPGADFRFLSFGRNGDDVLAIPEAALANGQSDGALGRIAGHWGQARDHLDAQAERQRREESELRERTRRAMLAALGHDFRTPLTVLKEGITQLPGAQEAGLTAEVERLRTLGENLLASARLDAGIPLALEPVDLVDPLSELERRHAQGGSPVVVEVDIPADLPLVRAEPVMLAHLLGNIIDNAVRHAERRVAITCRAEGGSVTLRIADDGPGVSPNLGMTIFEPFVTSRIEARGSGLGLAIARDLAKAMAADLSLEPPSEDAGAVFLLRLPIAGRNGEVA